VKRSSVVLVALFALIAAAAGWLLLRPVHSLPDDPLAAVPADSYGLVRIRIDRVLSSTAWQKLVVDRHEDRRIEKIRRICGMNPLEGLTELVVFMRPGQSDASEFAFTARGPLRHEALIDCVRKYTGANAAGMTRSEVEGVVMVSGKSGDTSAAFMGRDGIIGGDSESVRLSILTSQDKQKSISADAEVRELFKEVANGHDVAMVTRSPKAFLPLRGLVEALAGQELSVFYRLSTFAANADFGRDDIAGIAVAVADSEKDAATLVSLGERVRSRILDMPGIGLTGISGMLRAIEMKAEGKRATFKGAVTLTAAEAVLDILPALKLLRDRVSADPKPKAAPSAAPAADAGAGVDDVQDADVAP